MKKVLISLLFVVSCCALSAQEEQGWRLVWHDEFDGTGLVDSTLWKSERGFVRNHELQWYQPENAYRLNGILILEGRQDTITNPYYQSDSHDWRAQRPAAYYTSASINTRESYTFQYGRLEVRARIPAVCGAWPAIWTLGSSMPWPSCGELDLMEYYQIDGRPHVLANGAWGNEWNRAVWQSNAVPIEHFTEKDPQWAEKFHVWRMDWTEDSIVMSLDGERLNTLDLHRTVNGKAGQGRNPFQQPHYILLDLAIGGDHGGQPIKEAFPLRYEVDYVRVYQPE